MAAVDFHPLAVAEARAARRRYARVSLALAARFMAAIDDAVAAVEANPAGHPPYEHGTRACRLKRFPHRLVFLELTANRVLVVAVAHPSRRPGYWRRRLP
jgi:hypothetical protein